MSAGANEVATGKVIFLAVIAALAGQERYKLYQRFGLSRVWVCTARLHMWKGGIKPEGATGGMMDFCWLVFDHRRLSGPPDTVPLLGWV